MRQRNFLIGVFIYIYLLNSKKILLLKNQLIINIIKILISTIIMSSILVFSLYKFENYLDYSYNYKAIYLTSIIGFVGIFYLNLSTLDSSQVSQIFVQNLDKL